jgi:hypothetical protein
LIHSQITRAYDIRGEDVDAGLIKLRRRKAGRQLMGAFESAQRKPFSLHYDFVVLS